MSADKNSSVTPRTDAKWHQISEELPFTLAASDPIGGLGEIVPADFARQLERELRAAQSASAFGNAVELLRRVLPFTIINHPDAIKLEREIVAFLNASSEYVVRSPKPLAFEVDSIPRDGLDDMKRTLDSRKGERMKGAQFCRECGCCFPPRIGEGSCKRPGWFVCWLKWTFRLWWTPWV